MNRALSHSDIHTSPHTHCVQLLQVKNITEEKCNVLDCVTIVAQPDAMVHLITTLNSSLTVC